MRHLSLIAIGAVGLSLACTVPAPPAAPADDDESGAGGTGAAGQAAGSGGGGASGSGGGSGGTGGVAGNDGRGGRDGGNDGAPDAGPPRDAAGDQGPGAPDATTSGARFSFFVTSLDAMVKLSGNPKGFGGNLGGLAGADKICQTIAMEVGAGDKTWRAFLSATRGGPNDGPAHAIERIGSGPWYDRNGRLVAMDRAGLARLRPAGDAQAVSDLANEKGQAQKPFGDNHDVLTASNAQGRLVRMDLPSTCNDWTSADANLGGRPMCGHSWSRGSTQQNWLSEHTVPGCAAGVNLRDNTVIAGNCVGCNGGYGGIYCFALTP